MKVELLRHQLEALRDTQSRLICLTGGYGSGKTAAAVHWAISRGFANPKLHGIWVEPTYQLVKRVAVPDIKAALDSMGIPHAEHKSDMAMTVGTPSHWFKLYFHSGQHPERIVGQSAAWAVLDEAALMNETVFRNVLARVRHPAAKLSQIFCSTTPEGFNWVYERFEKNRQPGARLIRARTADNPFLPPEYLDALREQYNEQEFEQYCNGQFVAMSGAVYSRFDRDRHLAPCTAPLDSDLCIGADFNIGKMVWVLADWNGESLHVFAEHITHNRTTEESAEILDDKLRALFRQWGRKYEPAKVRFYCDASGSARRTSAARSDVQILRSFGWRVHHTPKNPAIRDRVASVNRALARDAVKIDPEGAPHVVECVQQQGYDAAGAPEKNGLDHGADALGYMVANLLPLTGGTFRDYKYH